MHQTALDNNTEHQPSLNGDNLFLYQCPDQEFESLKTYVKGIDWSEIKRRGNQPNAGRSYIPEAKTLHNETHLIELHRWVQSCINDAKRKIGWRKETIPELAITQSWLNRSDTGEEHHRHIHQLSILSGIMYITEPAETEFIVPSIYSLPTIIAPDKKSQFKSNTTTFKARAKTLVIFPSSLKHGVGPNLEPFSRYTLSVNTWIKGEHGVSDELAFIPEQLD